MTVALVASWVAVLLGVTVLSNRPRLAAWVLFAVFALGGCAAADSSTVGVGIAWAVFGACLAWCWVPGPAPGRRGGADARP